MARFRYIVRTPEGKTSEGVIEAPSGDLAIAALQRRNFIITSLKAEHVVSPIITRLTAIFQHTKSRDIVILSRQLSTLFEAQVPIIDSLRVLISETQSTALKTALTGVLEDIEGGSSISAAFSKHPEIFSNFYVSMVRSGEESGKLEEVFAFLADSLERSYAMASKAKNAMIYPAFILGAFVVVLVLMMVVVVPKLSGILLETGQELPWYTQAVMGSSSFLRKFGIFILLALLAGAVAGWRYIQRSGGRFYMAKLQLILPIFGTLFKKFYMARIADNLQTLISGNVSIIRALEITADTVGSEVYRRILLSALNSVRSGSTIADALSAHPEVPALVTSMIRIGESTGKLDFILANLSKFYRRDVDAAIDNFLGLIEPILILLLGGGVALLVASILVPIYNISAGL